jgi:hypothetical protein
MVIKNPLRNLAAPANHNVPAVAAGTQANLQQQLQVANQKIADLEARLQKLESAVYVAPNGDVEISSASNVRVIAGQRVEIIGDQGVTARDALGNSLSLSATGVTVTAAMKVVANSSIVEFNAATVTGNAAMAKFSGTVQCDTIVAVNVVGTSYTPGAGNVW